MTYLSFLRASLFLLYSNIWIKTFSIFSVIFLVIAFGLKGYIPQSYSHSTAFMLLFMGSFFILLFFPALMTLLSGIQYASDKRLKEMIQYEFSEGVIKVTGESFETKFDWDKLYKIKILKGWLFLYQNKLIANFVNTDSVKNEDLNGLKDFLVKHSLLKNTNVA